MQHYLTPAPVAAATAVPPVPVVMTAVKQTDVPIVLTGLGTVQALNTAVIRSQVTGLLQSVTPQKASRSNAVTCWVTFIPVISVPISLVGTFAVMYALNYSLDNLSLMALTIAVGFVVDGAIVMVENIVRHIEGGAGPLEAALKGAQNVCRME